MTFQPKKLSLVGIALLVASIALIFLSKLAVNQVAFNLFLLSSFTDVAALNMYTLLFAVAGYVLMAAGAVLFVYVAWRSRFVVDAPTVKRQLRVLIVAVAVLLVTLSLFCTQAASANSLATTGYYLATPYSPYDWLIGNFSSGSYYAINGSNWANMMTWPSPAPWSDYAGNSTQVIEAALAATTAGTVYLKEVPMDYGLTIPENVQVIENLNGLTRVFIDDGDSVGSPYTVSVDSVNPTYYTVQDSADRFIISWTSTNASYVANSVINTNGELHFAAGNFYFTSPIIIPTLKALSISGEGAATKLYVTADTNLIYSSASTVGPLLLKDFYAIYNYTGSGSLIKVFNGAGHVTLDNLQFETINTYTGSLLNMTSGSGSLYETIIKGCSINSAANVTLITYTGSELFLSASKFGSTATYGSININGGWASVTGCGFEHMKIRLDNTLGSVVNDNWFSEPRDYAVRVYNTGNVTISNNQIQNLALGSTSFGYGISLYGATNCTVIGNTITSSGSDFMGIREESGADYNTIMLNNVWGTYSNNRGIVTIGANTKCNLCWNATAWIS